jgi:hypothetical protein
MEKRASPIEGNGCFATVPIRAAEVVARWQGRLVPNAELERIVSAGLYHSSVAVGEDLNLLFGVFDPHRASEPVADGSGVGGFNHSCDPNLWMGDAVTVVGRRDIPAGEELTIDYALFTVAAGWRLSPCNCGSPSCRSVISGNDWQLPELQGSYEGHFSPFINERIQRLRRGVSS